MAFITSELIFPSKHTKLGFSDLMIELTCNAQNKSVNRSTLPTCLSLFLSLSLCIYLLRVHTIKNIHIRHGCHQLSIVRVQGIIDLHPTSVKKKSAIHPVLVYIYCSRLIFQCLNVIRILHETVAPY